MPVYPLRINGERHRVEAPASMPLLWVLRDLVGLTGTKYGCGKALCGSCTVMVGGRPIRSCVTPVSAVGDEEVTTVEGLAAGDGLHPVQRAWVAEEVPQCGYCQPGQVMSAAALLASTPDASDADVDRAMSGNVCRCGTYQRVRRAVRRAAREG